FDEALHRADVIANRLAGKDVTVAGLWFRRLDSESDNAAGLGGDKPGPAGRPECVAIRDNVVGGKRQHHGLGVAAAGNSRCRGDRRPRIAPHWFNDDRRVDADLLSLTSRKEM